MRRVHSIKNGDASAFTGAFVVKMAARAFFFPSTRAHARGRIPYFSVILSASLLVARVYAIAATVICVVLLIYVAIFRFLRATAFTLGVLHDVDVCRAGVRELAFTLVFGHVNGVIVVGPMLGLAFERLVRTTTAA